MLYEDDTGAPQRVDAGDDGESEAYPNLSSVPERPSRTPSRRAERQRVMDQLAADRANAAYSDEELRGDGAGRPRNGQAGDDTGGGPSVTAAEVPPEAELPEMPPAPSEQADTATARTSDARGDRDEVPAPAAEPADAEALERTTEATAAARETEAEADRTAEGAGRSRERQSREDRAATTGGETRRDRTRQTQQAARPSDATEQGTAGTGGVDRGDIPQIEPSQRGEPIGLPSRPDRTQTARRSSPEVQRPDRSSPPAAQGPQAGAGNQLAVIYFSHGAAALNGQDREVLREVAKLQQRRGANLRIVGHASSRTATMDMVKHRVVNLDISMARAETVADTLVSMGVPRDRIRVEARADRDPVYHEFMPTGEAGNRRAEIFLER